MKRQIRIYLLLLFLLSVKLSFGQWSIQNSSTTNHLDGVDFIEIFVQPAAFDEAVLSRSIKRTDSARRPTGCEVY